MLKLNKDELELIFEKLSPNDIAALCDSSPNLREFCRRYRIRSKMIGEFAKLNGDLLANVQKENSPFEVVKFCSINDGFRKACNQRRFWSSMLRYHYPDLPSESSDKLAREAYLRNTDVAFVFAVEEYNALYAYTDHLGNEFPAIEDFGDLVHGFVGGF